MTNHELLDMHTPGPWTLNHEHDVILPNSKHVIAWTGNADLDYNDETVMLANARLIAAAPDMLAALRVADAFLDNFPLYAQGEAAKTIRAAIAKAVCCRKG